MGRQLGTVAQLRRLLGQQSLQPQQQREVAPPLDRGLLRPFASSLSAASSARRRAVPGASASSKRLALEDETFAREQFCSRNRCSIRKRGGSQGLMQIKVLEGEVEMPAAEELPGDSGGLRPEAGTARITLTTSGCPRRHRAPGGMASRIKAGSASAGHAPPARTALPRCRAATGGPDGECRGSDASASSAHSMLEGPRSASGGLGHMAAWTLRAGGPSCGIDDRDGGDRYWRRRCV